MNIYNKENILINIEKKLKKIVLQKKHLKSLRKY